LTRPPKKPAQEPDDAAIPSERKAFAENLTRLRRQRNWTQAELADASGVGQSHISRLEKGTWEPRLATIMSLAKALGVQPGELLPSLNDSSR
jgi:transcriptional regulator with XRE-family HTH domain